MTFTQEIKPMEIFRNGYAIKIKISTSVLITSTDFPQ